MTHERTRERNGSPDINIDNEVTNVSPIDDSEDARQTVMDRYNAGESVIQPPEDDGVSLGEAIREQLRTYK
jgi:hypothetical protein